VPKNMTQNRKPSQKPMQQKKGNTPKKDVHARQKDTSPAQGEHRVGETMTQEIPSEATPQEIGPPK
jgi:hypothetical protein